MHRVMRSRVLRRLFVPLALSVVAFVSISVLLADVVSGANGAAGTTGALGSRRAQGPTGATGASGPQAPTGPSAQDSSNATDSYMSLPNSPDFDYSGSFSFEIWVKPAASYGNYQAIACNTLYPSTGWLVATDIGGGLIFQTGDGSGSQHWAKTTTSLVSGVWNHVAAVANGSTMLLYLNGTLVASASGVGFPTTQPLKIGGACGTPQQGLMPPFGFSYDHAAIYRRVLSASEVQAHYNAPAVPPSPAPLSMWRLDESSV
jgi:hypothetical protein